MAAFHLPWTAVLVVVAAAIFIVASYLLARRGHWAASALAVALAAFSIRAYAASDRQLHAWDERYHALVAKHLIERPLKPVLYADPVLPYDYTDWYGNHVWLHKPPLALWAQAASMRTFGVREWSMRLPSIVFSSAAVLVTFGVGWLLFSPRVALLAANFHALSGFHVDLASGRRASDHVDTLLLFLVEAGVLAGLVAARRRLSLAGVCVGVACGLALLTKSLTGLLLLAIWAAVRLLQPDCTSRARVAREVTIAAAVAFVIATPWAYYAMTTFPREFQHESLYAWRHATEALEDHGGPFWQYIKDMPRDFGILIYVPLVLAVAAAIKGTADPAMRIVLCWAAIPFVVFSAMATKMPGYVMLAAPALFLIQAEVWLRLRDMRAGETRAVRRWLLAAALVLLALSPAQRLLTRNGPLENGPREHEWVRDLQDLNREIGASRAVIFNMPTPIEAMFYTSYVAYAQMPAPQDIDGLRGRGYTVYIYQPRTPEEAPRVMRADVASVASRD